MSKIAKLRDELNQKTCVKVIAGINNFDMENIKKVVTAAEMGKASAVDVAAREDIIALAKELTSVPVFVSSVKPEELKMAIDNGADAIEVGNFDALYAKGLRVGADEVLEITRQTRALVGDDVFLSVTVPGHISVDEQIRLAQQLENLNVDLIQTEGAAVANVANTGARGLLETANVSIANTIEIARNTDIPVMTASGITPTTAKMAFAAGANAIGVGSCINKLNSVIEMVAVVRSLVESTITPRVDKVEDALV